MHFATTLIVAAAAAGVSAHPSGHVHGHRAFHSKKAQISEREPKEITTTAVINGKEVEIKFSMDHKPEPAAPSPVVAAVKAPEPSKEAPKETKPASGSAGGKGVTSYTPFCKDSKRSPAPPPVDYSETSLADIMRVGNLGKCGYGSNIMLVASEAAMSGYTYGAKVIAGGKKLKCGAYNKATENKEIKGFFPQHFAKSFTVDANSEQWLAFDEDTQGGVMCTDKDDWPTNNIGLPTVTWAELDCGNAKNDRWSGWDASGLTPFDYGQPCTALKMCAYKLPKSAEAFFDKSMLCSTINAGMACDGTNAYTAGTNNKGGLGSKIAAIPAGEQILWSIDYS